MKRLLIPLQNVTVLIKGSIGKLGKVLFEL